MFSGVLVEPKFGNSSLQRFDESKVMVDAMAAMGNAAPPSSCQDLSQGFVGREQGGVKGAKVGSHEYHESMSGFK